MQVISVLVAVSLMHSQPIEGKISGTVVVVSTSHRIATVVSVGFEPRISFNNFEWEIEPQPFPASAEEARIYRAALGDILNHRGESILISGRRIIKKRNPPNEGFRFVIEADDFHFIEK